METPAKDTEHRLKQYLDDMATTLSSLTSRAEQAGKDRVQLRSFFKQLHSLLLIQQKKDISAARNDHLLAGAQRQNASLLDQKKACIERHATKINHLREKIARTSGHEDRARYEEILSVMEELAADEACKWDMDIMLHWFDSYTKPSAKRVTARQTETSSGGQAKVAVDTADTTTGTVATDPDPKPHKSLVVRALDLYAEEVREYLYRRLQEAEEEISTLRQHHRAAFVADVDRTLSVFARMGAVPSVASIRDDVSQLKQLEIDVNTQHVISTIVDKAQEQFERSEKNDKQSWEALLLRVEAFRDANATRNDTLLQNTLELTTTVNREIDAVVARTTELSLGIDALQSEETRRLVQAAVSDLIATLNIT